MSETLSRRVGRLISGGFHAVLDKAEDFAPVMTLQENIREIERAIEEVRSELGKIVAQKHLATKKLSEENSRHEALNASIQAAIAAGRDDLASAGISEQMDIEARLPVLAQTMSDCAAQEKSLDGFILALQAKRREMQQAIADYQTVQQAACEPNHLSTNHPNPIHHISQRVEQSTQAFERVMQRQTGSAPTYPSAAHAADLQELATLKREQDIRERLAKWKAG